MSWSAKYTLRKLSIRLSACCSDAKVVCCSGVRGRRKHFLEEWHLMRYHETPKPQAFKCVCSANKATHTRLTVYVPDRAAVTFAQLSPSMNVAKQSLPH
jgi:hypothetical protein